MNALSCWEIIAVNHLHIAFLFSKRTIHKEQQLYFRLMKLVLKKIILIFHFSTGANPEQSGGAAGNKITQTISKNLWLTC